MAFLFGKNGVAFLIGKKRCGVLIWEDTTRRSQLGRHDTAFSVGKTRCGVLNEDGERCGVVSEDGERRGVLN